METNTLPTIEEFQDDYAKKFGYGNWTEFCAFESKGTIIQETRKIISEYAVLFAKWHRQKAIDRCVELAPYDKGIYENAYPESLIK